MEATDRRVPDAPRIGGSLRAAAVDFYFNSWRLVPANLLWGLAALVLLLLDTRIAALLLPLLAIPTAGVYRLAALIVRGGPASFGDVLDGYRRFLGAALAVGIISMLAATVFVVNLVNGLVTGSVVGWAFATVAGWSLLLLVVGLVVAWPIVVDPLRADDPVRGRLRLAALLVLAYPLRMGALAAVAALLMVVSAVLFAALLTLSVAFVALLSCRYVLPVADRFEGRATLAVAS